MEKLSDSIYLNFSIYCNMWIWESHFTIIYSVNRNSLNHIRASNVIINVP